MKVKLSEIRDVVRDELRLIEAKLTGQALYDELMSIAVEMGDVEGWDIHIEPGYLTDTLADEHRHSKVRWSDDEARQVAKKIADKWNADARKMSRYDENIQLERRMREADLADGSKAPWGSPQHVKELEISVRDLERHRNAQRRGSDARATYGRALQRLKAQLKSAKREAEKRRVEAQKKRKPKLVEALSSIIELDRGALEVMISKLEPDAVSQHDYVDAATGEVVLEKGEPARMSELHPQHAADVAGRAQERGRSIVIDGWEPDERIASFEAAYDVREELLSDTADMHPDDLAEIDIEDRHVPAVISRKDSKPFDQSDVDNVQEYLDDRVSMMQHHLATVGLQSFCKVGDTQTSVWPDLG